MAVNDITDGYALPCGRGLEDLWARLQAGDRLVDQDEHERNCPHCQAAGGSLRMLNEATRQLADEPIAPRPALIDRIMSAVRAEARRGEMVPLPTRGGPIGVSEQAIAVVLRFAADGVPGVRARRCTVRTRSVDEQGSGVIDVELSLALRYGVGPAEQILAEVRARVAAAAAVVVGIRVDTCDLRLEDLYP
jgi:hypothetical protein